MVSQLSLGNMIPKLIYPGDDYDNEIENLDEKDEGLTYQEFEHHKSISSNSEQNFNKVEIEDLGENLEEDFVDLDQRNSIPQDSEKGNSSEPNSEGEDDGSWILNLIDLSGLEDWPEHLKIEAKEMLKRNAKTFSKNDLDMGRTNLVKHHIKLTDPIPFKEAYTRILPQMYDEVKANIQEMLDLGAIRPSNSPWTSAIVLVRKKDGRLRFCIDLRKLNNRTVKDAYSLPKIDSILGHFHLPITCFQIKCGKYLCSKRLKSVKTTQLLLVVL